MMQRTDATPDFPEVYDLRSLTAIGVGVAVRLSIAQSLATQYPRRRELPAEFRDLLARLDKQSESIGEIVTS